MTGQCVEGVAIDDEMIDHLLDPLRLMAAVEQVHIDLHCGVVANPVAADIVVPGAQAAVHPMIAVSGVDGVCVAKIMTDSPERNNRGAPRQLSTILVTDLDSGRVRAILAGGRLTAARTAAASAVASSHLAAAGARVLGVIGAGRLALEHVRFLIARIDSLDTVVVWSRSARRTREFVSAISHFDCDVQVVDDPREVCSRADIVCTLTPSPTPILRGEWLRAGTHLNVVGAPPRPDHREIDAEALRRSRVIVDDVATARTASGAVVAALRHGVVDPADVATDLGAVISGDAIGRTGDDEITMFVSVGLGAQDLAAVRVLLDLDHETLTTAPARPR
ncbi:ornithine cyclodeaminase family protein [Gordonia sp. L191]|uniref:ornithine cyclodeaminase family protein n=1 Tax=Gordonia sp. L191 TaxID=2982699 RepID=UPI0024BF13E3|nr:ornithine cyclodeaminase family protein [Gordonia sp. L191]WHU46401.1 ornithine cyclodeaminase family protein [Gordonia sp. L191]